MIDIHAHIFPQELAIRAADGIGSFYTLPNKVLTGTVDKLLREGEKAGISHHVVHGVAMNEKHIESVNNFLIETVRLHGDRITAFGAMHPNYENVHTELRRMKDNGLSGVKIHPDMQNIYLDSGTSIRMFSQIAEMGMPAMVHMGDYRYSYSHPRQMEKLLNAVPNLVVICAHLGGWSQWSQAWQALSEREQVWVDTSASLYYCKKDEGAELIRKYNADRIMFGTDFPGWYPQIEVERFNALPLTAEEKEKISTKNAIAFLKKHCNVTLSSN